MFPVGDKESVIRVVLPLSDFDPNFSLSTSLISYGHVLLAPNRWRPAPPEHSNPDDGSIFSRPLRIVSSSRVPGGKKKRNVRCDRDGAVEVRLWQENASLVIEHGEAVFSCSSDDDGSSSNNNNHNHEDSNNHHNTSITSQVLTQIKRMIRYDADLSNFHEMSPQAKSLAWGRTYCAPTLWEDLVKTITNCNMQWKGTCDMNRKLCTQLNTPLNSFPTPHEILTFTTEQLKSTCRLGYRSAWIRSIAQRIVDGTTDPPSIERDLVHGTPEQRCEARRRLGALPGVGPFALANLLQLCGRTDVLPFDTETCRLWAEDHGAGRSTDRKNRDRVMKDAENYYRENFPGEEWRAYWFDLWRNYEARRGCDSRRWTIPTDEVGEAAFSNTGGKKQKKTQKTKKIKGRDHDAKKNLAPMSVNENCNIHENVSLDVDQATVMMFTSPSTTSLTSKRHISAVAISVVTPPSNEDEHHTQEAIDTLSPYRRRSKRIKIQSHNK